MFTNLPKWNLAIFKYLLENFTNDIDINAKCDKGFTVLDKLKKNKWQEGVDLVMKVIVKQDKSNEKVQDLLALLDEEEAEGAAKKDKKKRRKMKKAADKLGISV